MGFLEFVGLSFILYHLFYLIVPWFLDGDIRLIFCEKLGVPLKTLKHKVVWITGASSGLGEHLAYELAKIGCKLIISARRENELQRVKINCLDKNKDLQQNDIKVIAFDVCDYELHQKIFDDVILEFGRLDILVNNAGRSQRAAWEKIDLMVDRDMFDLNVFSVLSLSRIAMKYFISQARGQIAITSSLAGIIGVPYSASYTGTKHALHGYFESLRTEKAEHKDIVISIMCPGPIQTDFLREAFTENPGEKFGEETKTADNKMSASRCGKLMAVAIANQLDEVWISKSQALSLTYLVKRYPNVGGFVYSNFLGPRFLQKIRDDKVTVHTQ